MRVSHQQVQHSSVGISSPPPQLPLPPSQSHFSHTQPTPIPMRVRSPLRSQQHFSQSIPSHDGYSQHFLRSKLPQSTTTSISSSNPIVCSASPVLKYTSSSDTSPFLKASMQLQQPNLISQQHQQQQQQLSFSSRLPQQQSQTPSSFSQPQFYSQIYPNSHSALSHSQPPPLTNNQQQYIQVVPFEDPTTNVSTQHQSYILTKHSTGSSHLQRSFSPQSPKQQNHQAFPQREKKLLFENKSSDNNNFRNSKSERNPNTISSTTIDRTNNYDNTQNAYQNQTQQNTRNMKSTTTSTSLQPSPLAPPQHPPPSSIEDSQLKKRATSDHLNSVQNYHLSNTTSETFTRTSENFGNRNINSYRNSNTDKSKTSPHEIYPQQSQSSRITKEISPPLQQTISPSLSSSLQSPSSWSTPSSTGRSMISNADRDLLEIAQKYMKPSQQQHQQQHSSIQQCQMQSKPALSMKATTITSPIQSKPVELSPSLNPLKLTNTSQQLMNLPVTKLNPETREDLSKQKTSSIEIPQGTYIPHYKPLLFNPLQKEDSTKESTKKSSLKPIQGQLDSSHQMSNPSAISPPQYQKEDFKLEKQSELDYNPNLRANKEFNGTQLFDPFKKVDETTKQISPVDVKLNQSSDQEGNSKVNTNQLNIQPQQQQQQQQQQQPVHEWKSSEDFRKDLLSQSQNFKESLRTFQEEINAAKQVTIQQQQNQQKQGNFLDSLHSVTSDCSPSHPLPNTSNVSNTSSSVDRFSTTEPQGQKHQRVEQLLDDEYIQEEEVIELHHQPEEVNNRGQLYSNQLNERGYDDDDDGYYDFVSPKNDNMNNMNSEWENQQDLGRIETDNAFGVDAEELVAQNFELPYDWQGLTGGDEDPARIASQLRGCYQQQQQQQQLLPISEESRFSNDSIDAGNTSLHENDYYLTQNRLETDVQKSQATNAPFDHADADIARQKQEYFECEEDSYPNMIQNEQCDIQGDSLQMQRGSSRSFEKIPIETNDDLEDLRFLELALAGPGSISISQKQQQQQQQQQHVDQQQKQQQSTDEQLCESPWDLMLSSRNNNNNSSLNNNNNNNNNNYIQNSNHRSNNGSQENFDSIGPLEAFILQQQQSHSVQQHNQLSQSQQQSQQHQDLNSIRSEVAESDNSLRSSFISQTTVNQVESSTGQLGIPKNEVKEKSMQQPETINQSTHETNQPEQHEQQQQQQTTNSNPDGCIQDSEKPMDGNEEVKNDCESEGLQLNTVPYPPQEVDSSLVDNQLNSEQVQRNNISSENNNAQHEQYQLSTVTEKNASSKNQSNQNVKEKKKKNSFLDLVIYVVLMLIVGCVFSTFIQATSFINPPSFPTYERSQSTQPTKMIETFTIDSSPSEFIQEENTQQVSEQNQSEELIIIPDSIEQIYRLCFMNEDPFIGDYINPELDDER